MYYGLLIYIMCCQKGFSVLLKTRKIIIIIWNIFDNIYPGKQFKVLMGGNYYYPYDTNNYCSSYLQSWSWNHLQP